MRTAVGVVGGDVPSVGNRPAQAGEPSPVKSELSYCDRPCPNFEGLIEGVGASAASRTYRCGCPGGTETNRSGGRFSLSTDGVWFMVRLRVEVRGAPF